jgi:ADP-ribose pyrophosphatase
MKNDQNKLAYQCKVFSVYEEKVALPDGRSVKQSWIDHKPTVAVVAVNTENKVLMIKQYRTAVKNHLLEIPAGTMDVEGESPVICAQRELAEETGFKARTLIKLFEGYLVPGYCNEYMYFFLAKDLYYEPLSADDDEFIEVLPTSFAEAKKMLKNGEIIDAKTALGLIFTENYIESPHSFEK